MRILLTGATGFVGSNLMLRLEPEHEVFALARTPPGGVALGQAHWIRHDLTRPLDYTRLPSRVDAVIHLAQSKFYRQFPDKARDIFDVNIGSTFNLLEYARQAGAERFIFASSGGVYGYSYEKFVETDPVEPLDFYLSSKYTAELLTANYQPYFLTIVFRFFFVYGPDQTGMLIPSLLQKVREGVPITIEGNPGIRINPIHVCDAIRVFEPALNLSVSDLFNVAGDEVVSITDLVAMIEQVIGVRASVEHRGRARDGDLIGDNSRMKQVLGVSPRVSLLDGLRSMMYPSSAARLD